MDIEATSHKDLINKIMKRVDDFDFDETINEGAEVIRIDVI